MKSKIFDKITIIDILIIICVIAAVGFALFHIVSDDSNDISSTSFDSSTNNKILEKYLEYYKDGNIIKSTVAGTNSSSGEKIEMEADVVWVGTDSDDDVYILLEKNGEKFLAGLYKDIPNADIYYNQISLETTGEKYSNIKELKISAGEINSLKDLVSEIPKNCRYELSAELSIDNLDQISYQKLINALSDNKKPCIYLNQDGSLTVDRADSEDIEIADSVLGQFEAQTGEITLRLYDCSDADLNKIKKAYNPSRTVDI